MIYEIINLSVGVFIFSGTLVLLIGNSDNHSL